MVQMLLKVMVLMQQVQTPDLLVHLNVFRGNSFTGHIFLGFLFLSFKIVYSHISNMKYVYNEWLVTCQFVEARIAIVC
jgi:hypothetical protein